MVFAFDIALPVKTCALWGRGYVVTYSDSCSLLCCQQAGTYRSLPLSCISIIHLMCWSVYGGNTGVTQTLILLLGLKNAPLTLVLHIVWYKVGQRKQEVSEKCGRSTSLRAQISV